MKFFNFVAFLSIDYILHVCIGIINTFGIGSFKEWIYCPLKADGRVKGETEEKM